MTFRTIALVFCTMLISVLVRTEGVLAQPLQDIEASLQWGDRQKAPTASQLAKVISSGSWGAYVLRYKPGRGFSGEKYWIEHYNRQMDMTGRFEFELPGEKGADLEDIISLRGQLYLLLSRPDPAQDISQVLLRPFSPRGQVTGQERLLAELPQDEKFRRRQFDLEFNRDSSFLLLYNQLPPERDGPERFTLRVFDDAMQLQWSRDVTLPHADRGFNIRSYQLDQEGNVFLLGRKDPANSELGQIPVYYVYAYTRNGQKETVYKLDIAEVQLNKLMLKISGNGDLVCAGLYSLPGRETNEGICHLRINPLTQEAYKVDLLPFTAEFLAVEDGDDAKSRLIGLKYYQLRELILRSDGGIVLTAEQYFRTEASAVPRGMGAPSNTLFHYNDIMVANIAPDGTYTWLRRIPKQQVTANDNGWHSSFVQATVQDRFLFLYNDHPDQYRPKNNQGRSLEEQNTIISLTEIQRSGEMTTLPLYLNRDGGMMARPRRCRQIGARQMLVYGEEGRVYRLGLLTF